MTWLIKGVAYVVIDRLAGCRADWLRPIMKEEEGVFNINILHTYIHIFPNSSRMEFCVYHCSSIVACHHMTFVTLCLWLIAVMTSWPLSYASLPSPLIALAQLRIIPPPTNQKLILTPSLIFPLICAKFVDQKIFNCLCLNCWCGVTEKGGGMELFRPLGGCWSPVARHRGISWRRLPSGLVWLHGLLPDMTWHG